MIIFNGYDEKELRKHYSYTKSATGIQKIEKKFFGIFKRKVSKEVKYKDWTCLECDFTCDDEFEMKKHVIKWHGDMMKPA